MLKDDYYTNDCSVHTEMTGEKKTGIYEEMKKQRKLRKYSKFIDVLKLKIKHHYLSTTEQ